METTSQTAPSASGRDQTAQVFDLAQPMFSGMPCSPNQPGFRMALTRRHGDYVRSDGTSGSSEMIFTGGHVGTHMDALTHASADGCLHGGIDAHETQRGGSFKQLGIDTIPPLLGKGLLFDVPAYRECDVLPPAYEITAADLAGTAARFGLDLTGITFALVRTGWPTYWNDAERYVGAATGVPGPGPDAAAWLADLGITATGSDTIAYERIPSAEQGVAHRLMPVHKLLLVERGIYIIEVLNLEDLAAHAVHEFTLLVAPLKFVGGTGAPVRPVAWTNTGQSQ